MGRFVSASSMLLVGAMAVMFMGCGEATTSEAAGDAPVTVKGLEDLPNCAVGKYAIVYYVQDDPGSGYYFCDGWNYHLLDLSGLDGISVLFETEPIEATGEPPCPNGGTVLRVGPDAAPYDGIMDSVSTNTICNGLDGADGQSCTVTDYEDHAIITCEDGTSATIDDGNDCTVISNGDGTSTIQCDDGSSVTVIDPCSVDNGGCGPTEVFTCGITVQVVNLQAITGIACDVQDDLSGADLSGLDLSGEDLSGVNLSGANLTDTVLLYANLTGANLTNAILIRANLYQAIVGGADFSGADLSEASANYVDFSQTTLTGATFTNASLAYANFVYKVLGNLNFSGANLYRANMRYAQPYGADLSNANLYQANLYRANLNGADLSGASLYDAYLLYANFRNADLRDADLYASDYAQYATLYGALYNAGTRFPYGFGSPAAKGMVYVAECGNGLHEPGEECDDGNTQDGDGCQSDCTIVCVEPLGTGPWARIVALGAGGVQWMHAQDSTGIGDNLQLNINALAWLGEGHSALGEYQILFSDDCDPRVDPAYCNITSDWDRYLQPWFDAIASLGTITYAKAAAVPDLSVYSAVILDFCDYQSPDDLAAVDAFLRAGGRVFVADNKFCGGNTDQSTALLARFGLKYTDLSTYDTTHIYIPVEQQTGLLEGVAEFYPRSHTALVPNVCTDVYTTLIQHPIGPLAVYGEFDTSGLP